MPALKELKKNLLSALKEGYMSHAVLIEGEKGTGKRELALWLASAMLCREENAPCGKCAVCRKIADGNHPDVFFVLPEEKKRSIGIESIRELKETLWLMPNESSQKIYIIPNADIMTPEAQNALLKSLEEPPSHARFILTCDNKNLLLDTIISRVTVYELSAATGEECAEELLNSFPELSSEEAKLVSMAYCGNIGAASEALKEEKLGMIKLAAETPELLRRAKGYELLSRLAPYSSDRAIFGEYLERLGNIVGRCGIDFAGKRETLIRVTPAEAIKTKEIIERGKEAVYQNCMSELISGWVCMELSGVFGGNI